MRPFPRAIDDPTLLSRDVWNRLVETVEMLGRLAVAPPLELAESAAGRTLSLRPSAPSAVVVKITASAAGGGAYTGRVLTGRSTATGLATLVMPEGMTIPSADDALILNLAENGKSTHDLSAGRFAPGVVIGTTSDGRKIVAIDAVEFQDCPSS